MNNKKKKILAIILVGLILILGGASVYVATQMSTRQAVAPTAPTSKPRADEVTWSSSCTATASATAVANTIDFVTEAFSNDSGNVAGTYAHTNALKKTGDTAVVKPGETYVYFVWAHNPTTATVSSAVTFTNVLSGSNLDKLTFIDSSSDCSYNSTSRTVTCKLSRVNPGTWGLAFRVKLADDATSGAIIKASTTATYDSNTGLSENSLTVTGEASMTLAKQAYANVSSNTAGNYSMPTSSPISSVNAGDTFVYAVRGYNKGLVTASATVTDTLTDNFTYVDGDSACSYNSSSRVVTCALTDIPAGGSIRHAFRVTLDSGVADGTEISNTATLTYGSNLTTTALKSITVNNPVSALLTGSKTAYKNATSNTAGKYTLTTEMDTVSKSQTYVYAITLTNSEAATATGVTVKDSLAEATNLTFMDAASGCTWNATDKVVTCNTTIQPSATKTFAFRVKASAGIANGDIISNTATVTYNGEELSLTKDLTVSTVVGCNNTCTTDEECTSGLTCDPTTSKCRLAACLTEDDCVCATTVKTTTTTTTTKTVTATPTKVVATKSATPTILPETGILDIPGVAAFGGGLFLAVVGILLAL